MDELDYYYQLIQEEEYFRLEDSDDCKHNYIPLDGHYICDRCGIYHRNKFYLSDGQTKPLKQKYRRKGYFREKLRLLTGKKQSISEKYNEMLNKLRIEFKSNDINELRKLVKTSYGKYSKYIHSIYYDLTNERLINLTEKDVIFLEKEFYDFEKEFKILYPGSYYMLSYNIIIHHLLKKNGYDCYKNILLPKNSNKTKYLFCEILRD